MPEYEASVEMLDRDGCFHLVRVHRRAEYIADKAAGCRPRYFSVCVLVRRRPDPRFPETADCDPDCAEVKGWVVRDPCGREDLRAVVRVMERAAVLSGFRRYRLEEVTRVVELPGELEG